MSKTIDNGGAFTDRLLHDAAVSPVGSALDVGCGDGDVTFRLVRLAGPSGHVTGIDLNDAALVAARKRAQQEGHANVTFHSADLHEPPLSPTGDEYDLITCRRVLMYLADPVRAVAAMLRALRPGGRLVVQEHDGSRMAGGARLPLNEKVHRLVWDTIAAEGGDTAIGLKLHAILSEAGAAHPEIRAEAVVQTADQSAPAAMIVKMMADRIVTSGTAMRGEIDALDLDTLDERLAEERRAARATFIAETIFGALASKPT